MSRTSTSAPGAARIVRSQSGKAHRPTGSPAGINGPLEAPGGNGPDSPADRPPISRHPAARSPFERTADGIAGFGGTRAFGVRFPGVPTLWIARNVAGRLFAPFDGDPLDLANPVPSGLAPTQVSAVMRGRLCRGHGDRARAEAATGIALLHAQPDRRVTHDRRRHREPRRGRADASGRGGPDR